MKTLILLIIVLLSSCAVSTNYIITECTDDTISYKYNGRIRKIENFKKDQFEVGDTIWTSFEVRFK